MLTVEDIVHSKEVIRHIEEATKPIAAGDNIIHSVEHTICVEEAVITAGVIG